MIWATCGWPFVFPRFFRGATRAIRGSSCATARKRGTGMTDATDATTDAEKATGVGEQKQQEQKTFTQAEVNVIVRDRLKQQATNQFGDYDDLKTRAEGAKTLEERLADVEGELSATKAAALRTAIAAEFGISTKKGAKGEPSDADLFLTGTDEAALTAQAQRLAGRQADSKKQGNVAPNEGDAKTTGKTDGDLREFARGLFNAE